MPSTINIVWPTDFPGRDGSATAPVFDILEHELRESGRDPQRNCAAVPLGGGDLGGSQNYDITLNDNGLSKVDIQAVLDAHLGIVLSEDNSTKLVRTSELTVTVEPLELDFDTSSITFDPRIYTFTSGQPLEIETSALYALSSRLGIDWVSGELMVAYNFSKNGTVLPEFEGQLALNSRNRSGEISISGQVDLGDTDDITTFIEIISGNGVATVISDTAVFESSLVKRS